MSKKRIKTVRHGMYHTRQYGIWSGIKRRCYNKNEKTYKRYGAKGIKMCDSWRNGFMEFWNDMKEGYFETAQIDRIYNNKGYSKENCRWVTMKEQANNKKSVKLYTYKDKKMNASDWDRYLGLKIGTVRARIKYYDWDIEKALTTKKKKYKGYIKDNRGKYRVEIKRKNKRYFVGRFDTKKEALEKRKDFLHKLLI